MSADPPAAHSPPAPEPTPEPGAPTTAATTTKSGGGCLKGCLGCGCLSIIGLGLILLAAGGFFWLQGPELREGIAEGFTVVSGSSDRTGSNRGGFDLSTLDNLASGEPRPTTGAPQGAQTSSPAGRSQVDGYDRFFDLLDTPVSRRDIERLNSTLNSWEETRTVKRFHSVLDDAKEIADDDSLGAGLQKIRLAISMAFRVRDISQEFPEFVEKNGGDDFRRKYTQLLAIHRVSQIASGNQHEPWEQPVADALLQDHDANQEQFQANRAKIAQFANNDSLDFEDLPEAERAEMLEAFANQFTLLTSAINRTSLESWAALSDNERQAVAEQFSSPQSQFTRAIGMLTTEDGQDMLLFHLMGN